MDNNNTYENEKINLNNTLKHKNDNKSFFLNNSAEKSNKEEENSEKKKFVFKEKKYSGSGKKIIGSEKKNNYFNQEKYEEKIDLYNNYKVAESEKLYVERKGLVSKKREILDQIQNLEKEIKNFEDENYFEEENQKKKLSKKKAKKIIPKNQEKISRKKEKKSTIEEEVRKSLRITPDLTKKFSLLKQDLQKEIKVFFFKLNGILFIKIQI